MRLLKPHAPTWTRENTRAWDRVQLKKLFSLYSEVFKDAYTCTQTHFAVYVDQAAVALGGAIKFPNSSDSESLDELLPHRGTEAITYGNTDPVMCLRWADRLGQQVTADFAYVLDYLDMHTNRDKGQKKRRPVSIDSRESIGQLSCSWTHLLWQWVPTVQLCLTQSSQKWLAENFLLTTTVKPKSKHWPTPMMVPVNSHVNTYTHV